MIWNILSCKNSYKKFASLQEIRTLLIEIIQAGCLNEFDSAFNEYESFFLHFVNIESYIDKTLIPVNEIHEFLSNDIKASFCKLPSDKQDSQTQSSSPFQSKCYTNE